MEHIGELSEPSAMDVMEAARLRPYTVDAGWIVRLRLGVEAALDASVYRRSLVLLLLTYVEESRSILRRPLSWKVLSLLSETGLR